MEKRDYIKEAYDNCLKDAVLLVGNSGFSSRGSSSNYMIITKDNELYNYYEIGPIKFVENNSFYWKFRNF